MVFPTKTGDDAEVFDALIDSVKGMKYRVPYNIDPTDVGILHRRCLTWMEKAEKIVKSMLAKVP
jgi:thermostable 8-oxoguanine DNA glycosylase